MAAYKGVRKGTSGYKGSRGANTSGSGVYTKGRKAAMIPSNRVDPTPGSHGFGYSKGQCDGPLRLSGVAGAHRVGKS